MRIHRQTAEAHIRRTHTELNLHPRQPLLFRARVRHGVSCGPTLTFKKRHYSRWRQCATPCSAPRKRRTPPGTRRSRQAREHLERDDRLFLRSLLAYPESPYAPRRRRAIICDGPGDTLSTGQRARMHQPAHTSDATDPQRDGRQGRAPTTAWAHGWRRYRGARGNWDQGYNRAMFECSQASTQRGCAPPKNMSSNERHHSHHRKALSSESTQGIY